MLVFGPPLIFLAWDERQEVGRERAAILNSDHPVGAAQGATAIGLGIAKHVFHAHGADAAGRAVFSRRLTRGKLLDFLVRHPRCLVALEACGGAHHWARELRAMGHEVRLIPPAYVKPFVKRHKNDAADAEANRFHHSRTVSWHRSMPRSNSHVLPRS